MCTSTDSNNCLCTWLTDYIEIAITVVCKLLPWQQMILCKYLLSSCVAKVMGHIVLVLYIGVGLICTPICKMTMIYKTNIPRSEIL